MSAPDLGEERSLSSVPARSNPRSRGDAPVYNGAVTPKTALARAALTWTALAALVLASAAAAQPSSTRCTLGRPAVGAPNIVPADAKGSWFRLNDRSVARLREEPGPRLLLDTTRDGVKWATRELEALSDHRNSATPAAVLPNGNLVVFTTRGRCEAVACKVIARERFRDVWATTLAPDGRIARAPQLVFAGYVGDLRQPFVTSEGRILLPFAAWDGNLKAGPPTGPHRIKLVVSDDGGHTFRLVEPDLVAPVPDRNDLRASGYGAIEPAIGRRPDGKLLMLMRTQTGELWQSLSNDGLKWSPAERSGLPASSAPAFLLETRGGLLVVWNGTYEPSLVAGNQVDGGRDVLHAALMRPGSTRWSGFREILVDKDMLIIATGDSGTAYPIAVELPDGDILVASGQGSGRRKLVRFSPNWLLATERTETFSPGVRSWTGFQRYGARIGNKYNRRDTALPPANDPRLHFVAAEDSGAAALWNFPASASGQIDLEVSVSPITAMIELALLDRFVDPFDSARSRLAKAEWRLTAPTAGRRWMTLRWNSSTRLANVTLDGGPAVEVPYQPSAHGVNYIRLGFLPKPGSAPGQVATLSAACMRQTH
jgi:hypothetical protein